MQNIQRITKIITVQKLGWHFCLSQYFHILYDFVVSKVSSVKPICTANLVAKSPTSKLCLVLFKTCLATDIAFLIRLRPATAPMFKSSLF